MTAATLSNDTIALAFWRGRLANIVLIFEPIPVDEYNITAPIENNARLRQWDTEDDNEY